MNFFVSLLSYTTKCLNPYFETKKTVKVTLNKKIRNSIIVASLFLVLTIPIIAETAFAKPTDLPDQAKATVAPFKVRIIEHEGLTAVMKPYYTSLDNPTNHVTQDSDGFNGTGKLVIARDDSSTGFVGCSGTLLSTGIHVLTAAHCLSDSNGDSIWTDGEVTFTGNVRIAFASADIHPDYDGNLARGNDIAVITLESIATGITTYDIDRNQKDNVGAIGEKVGYGISGFFASGSDSSTYQFGIKRDGLNKYDDTADKMLKALNLKPGKDFVRNSVLQYDSDNGSQENDAFGFFFRNFDVGFTSGTEPQEVNSAGGDSGGSTFTTNSNGDKIVTGVTSYGLTLSFTDGRTSDCNLNLDDDGFNIPDSSCGEFSGDTSVAKYSKFIDSVTGGGGDEPTDEPTDEPNCPPQSNSPKCR